ncbi:alpha/beta hydrolase [Aureimonas mangrovi]|uniref:alpha/beta hydrolase n=1 Tax=Aureimonas mangrovi TaxID=2758041 RepID=UPI00163DCBEF|nr:alpha/beta fold hydrolase [Aureimonas mangrovi]
MKLRLGLAVLLILVVAACLIWSFGPREPVDATIRFDPAVIGPDPSAYIAAEEAQVPGLEPGAAKEIVWAYPASRARTPLAIVYIHGFSGDRREMAPVPQEVARRLGANLFLTRLSGHGRGLAALAEPSANDWLNDLAEALAIGGRIGERIIVLATSNGGALATWGASVAHLFDEADGLVLFSPNYRLRDWRAPLLTMPYARQVTELLTGGSFVMPLADPLPGGPDTVTLPSAALLPMAALSAKVRGLDFEAINLPALFAYSPNDRIVDPLETERVIARWGGPAEILLVPQTSDPTGHMLAGDMFSPGTTQMVVDTVTSWIERVEGF